MQQWWISKQPPASSWYPWLRCP